MNQFRPIQHGSTDQSVIIRILDSTDGTPVEDAEHNSSGIALWYRRDGATKTTITPAALAALDSAHSDGGIEHIDDGYYRLDVADAAFASGVSGVMIGGTITDCVIVGVYVPLTPFNPYAAQVDANVTQISGDSTAADTLELFAEILDQSTGQLDSGSLAAGTITAASIAGDAITAAKVASDVTTEIQSGLATAAELAKVPKSDGTSSWNATALAAINAQVDTALTDIHLDHLLAATYDPASKPGAADALLNELVENDGGVARFTANALEEAPAAEGGLTASEIADAVWDEALSGHTDAGSAAKALADIETDATAILADTDALTPFDPATDVVQANIVEINSVEIDGAGTEGDEWGPAS